MLIHYVASSFARRRQASTTPPPLPRRFRRAVNIAPQTALPFRQIRFHQAIRQAYLDVLFGSLDRDGTPARPATMPPCCFSVWLVHTHRYACRHDAITVCEQHPVADALPYPPHHTALRTLYMRHVIDVIYAPESPSPPLTLYRARRYAHTKPYAQSPRR